MDDKNNKHSHDNPNQSDGKKTLKDNLFVNHNTKNTRGTRGIKIAYLLAILVALGGAVTARLAANDAINDINATLPQDEVTLPTVEKEYVLPTEEPDFEVRQNLTDVPDTRQETETEPETEREENTVEATTEKKTQYAEPYTDYYTLPIGTKISKDYNPKTPVYNPTMGDWRTHAAIDFTGEDGAQVKAISNGTVTNIYEDALYGTVVEIDHGNEVIAKYCGLNKETLEVKVNGTVKSGTLIGYLGEIPCEKDEGSHLHFEITHKGENVDPLDIMGK